MRPTERWARLTAATATYMNAGDEKALEAGRYAIWLSRVLGDYIGCPERSRVLFYALEKGAEDTPQFRPAHSAWAAVSLAEDGFWQFGLGMELERGPGAYPRLRVCWPMRIRPGRGLTIQISGEKAVEIVPDKGGYLDFNPICETMFQLGLLAVELGSRGEKLPDGIILLVQDGV